MKHPGFKYQTSSTIHKNVRTQYYDFNNEFPQLHIWSVLNVIFHLKISSLVKLVNHNTKVTAVRNYHAHYKQFKFLQLDSCEIRIRLQS